MKRRILAVVILALTVGLLWRSAHAEVVACVGDSNTLGEGLLDPTHESYPAQLEMLLRQKGLDWEVRNFGVSGATILRQGDISYQYQSAYYEALACEPDYVILCFGANGSRWVNRGYIQDDYVTDYLNLIDSFLILPDRPRMLICYPPRAFSDIYSFSDAIIKDKIIPCITQVASQRKLLVVDLYTAFEKSPDLYQPDGIHPTAPGATRIAEIVAASLFRAIAPPDYNGDGRVDMEDLLMLVESWGQSDPMMDMAPPFGDGVIDGVDLEHLMSYWQQSVSDPTLVAHWTLDEKDGVTAFDSVSGNEDTLMGGPIWRPHDGYVDGALQLDGVDDVIVVDRPLSLAYRPFSVVAWVRAGVPGQTILSERGGAPWLSVGASDGALMTGLTDVAGRDGPLRSDAVVTDGGWHRIGLVWDGLQRMLSVDGIVIAIDQPDGVSGVGLGFHIGCGADMATGTYWSGLIDDVRIYSRALKLWPAS